MTDDSANNLEFDPVFLQLVTSLQIATMTDLGKLINPQTTQAERNLGRAQNSIDILGMLQRKTHGNLSPPEQEFIDHVLYELRMNFLDESQHPGAAAETPAEDEGEKRQPSQPAMNAEAKDDPGSP